MKHDVGLLPYQIEVMQAKEKEILLSGGIGTGKSYIAGFWLLNKIAENPGCKCLLSANTYSQLNNATVTTFIQILDSLGIKYKNVSSGSKKRIEVLGCYIYIYSLEKPDAMRGIEISFAVLDEVSYSTLEALNVVRGRMRGKRSKQWQILMTSSPNGFNFLYDIFNDIKPEDSRKYRLIKAKTKENIFLREGYYEELLEMYGGETSDLARQELFGDFVNLQSGSVYSHFDRAINVRPCKLDKKYPVYVGVDFNIEKMSYVAIQHINGVFYQCAERQLTHRDANTYDLGKRIIHDLVQEDIMGNGGYDVRIIPDSTGSQRKSSASKTDHYILKELGLNLMHTHNPLIRDRQQTVNVAFLRNNLVIDPSCDKTIKEIETLAARDKEGLVSHLSVCTGYVLYKLAPLKPKHQASRTISY